MSVGKGGELSFRSSPTTMRDLKRKEKKDNKREKDSVMGDNISFALVKTGLEVHI